MTDLPSWLPELKQTLPEWVRTVSHADGPGRHRFAVDAYEPYDLDSSCMVQHVVWTLGGDLMPDAGQRQQWIDYLLDLQRPEDGMMIDAGMERHIIHEGAAPTATEIFNVRRFTTRNGLGGVLTLGGKPRYRLAHEEAFHTPAEMIDYLEGLHWHNPWGAGSWAGAVLRFQHFNALLGEEGAEEIIAAGIDWLAREQDPQTGAWGRGDDIALHCLVNGIFKVWIQLLPVTNLRVQYPERVIDLCLEAMREDPALQGAPDACSIFDVALVLDVALRHCDHRREEVAALALQHLPAFEPMLRPDGAMSYGPEQSLHSHGGLALAPVKDQSDAAGTALIVHAIALLCNLAGRREELGWAPLTEWRMGLD